MTLQLQSIQFSGSLPVLDKLCHPVHPKPAGLYRDGFYCPRYPIGVSASTPGAVPLEKTMIDRLLKRPVTQADCMITAESSNGKSTFLGKLKTDLATKKVPSFTMNALAFALADDADGGLKPLYDWIEKQKAKPRVVMFLDELSTAMIMGPDDMPEPLFKRFERIRSMAPNLIFVTDGVPAMLDGADKAWKDGLAMMFPETTARYGLPALDEEQTLWAAAKGLSYAGFPVEPQPIKAAMDSLGKSVRGRNARDIMMSFCKALKQSAESSGLKRKESRKTPEPITPEIIQAAVSDLKEVAVA